MAGVPSVLRLGSEVTLGRARRNSCSPPKGFYGRRPLARKSALARDQGQRGRLARQCAMPPPPAPDKPCVTIVEDDVSLLNALAFALEADGYAVSPYTAASPLLAEP